MLENQSHGSKASLYSALSILFVIWLVSSWFIADFILESRARELIDMESAALKIRADNLVHNINNDIKHLHGVLSMIAKDEQILTGLAGLGATASRTSLSLEHQKKIWFDDFSLKPINAYLDLVSSSLGASVLWIMNASGDCIAASNANTSKSFVATNYFDREYFQEARRGIIGNQYAIGRNTNIPGLYFSAPIAGNSRKIGVAAAKIDLPDLSHWVNQAEAFITDKYGVIILARDKNLEMRSLPGASVIRLSEAERRARYKLTNFPPLFVDSWRDSRFPSVLHFNRDEKPLLMADRSSTNDEINLHVVRHLPQLAGFSTDRLSLFLLLAATGAAFLLFIGFRIYFVLIRKQAEGALRASEKKYRQIFENVQDIFFQTDLKGILTEISPSIERYEYSREKILGKLLYEVYYHFDDMAKLIEDIKEKGEIIDFEVRIKSKTGRLVYTSANCHFFYDEAKTAIGIEGSLRDITDRKLAEETIHQNEIRMRAITDSAQDAILMMDSEGRISYWNPAAERILGYTREEAIGQDLHALLAPPHHLKAHQAALPTFLQTGQGSAIGKTLELEARRKDGIEIPVELSLSAILINGGWHAVGLIRDVTERKRARKALQETMFELEQSNRFLEKATAKASDMAAQAEMANIAKSEFLANMSHEIRTPMNGVIGMITLLLDTELNEEQRRYAETVRASAESLLTLIDDILDLSKIEAGKLELETIDFDLRALLDDFAALLAVRAHDHGLEFICSMAPDMPTYLRGDPGRLRQVLVNLTGNAVKFTHQGEVFFRADLMSETDDEVMVRFSIKDSGIGIPPDKQNLLFQKFSQVDASTTRQYGGTGLGLAISKQLTEMMGGRIGLESQAGQGSKFWFTTRFAKQKEKKRNDPLPALIRGVHILVVDDNTTQRAMIMEQLEHWGAHPEGAPDGPAALQALLRASDKGDPFIVAILDKQMPGMDGVTLGRIIKTDDKLEDARLVLMTSLGQQSDAGQFGEIGFSTYLTKPVRQSDLFNSLSAALSGEVEPPPDRTIIPTHPIGEIRRDAQRILLAEDNITNQWLVLKILKKMALPVDAVTNGAEAVKALAIRPYDLVLMDVQMPELDGLEATRLIRNPQSNVLNHKIPIIAMTASAMLSDREKCLNAGMNDFLSKPFSPP
ncbi:MAG: PAS domain S-box protein, partial [Deltaproteobacteria bacterium]|nr:PAS domain S-box protein [Deltaproteobacteria bacterium]